VLSEDFEPPAAACLLAAAVGSEEDRGDLGRRRMHCSHDLRTASYLTAPSSPPLPPSSLRRDCDAEGRKQQQQQQQFSVAFRGLTAEGSVLSSCASSSSAQGTVAVVVVPVSLDDFLGAGSGGEHPGAPPALTYLRIA